MNCKTVQDRLIDYLYGELDQEQAESLRVHLQGCPQCAARADEFSRIREKVSGLPEPEPSLMAINRIRARAREALQPPGPVRGFGWLKILAPVLVMAVVVGYVSHQMGIGPFSKEVMLSPGRKESGAAITEKAKEEKRQYLATSPEQEEDTAAVAGRTRSEAEIGIPEKKAQFASGKALAPQGPVPAEAPSRLRDKASVRKAKPAAPPTLPAAPSAAPQRLDARQPAPHAAAGLDEAMETKAPVQPVPAMLAEAEKALEAGQYEAAAGAFSKVLEALPRDHPERPRALLGQARAYEGLGDVAKARRAYQALAMESPAHRDLAERKLRALAARDAR